MSRFKVLFEGERVVVVKLNGDMSIQDLIDSGVFIQRMNELYDKRGRKVIISQSEFFRAIPPKLTGECGGSVYEITGNKVVSAGHVVKCANKLEWDQGGFILVNKRVIMPRTYPGWLWDVFRWVGFEPYGSYDYGEAYVKDTLLKDYNDDKPYPRVMYVAGNCLKADESNCLGVALLTPDSDPDSLVALVDRGLIVDCTYWGYKPIARGVDVGNVFVNYGNGNYALLKPALLMAFTNKAGIPGCSGSMVYPIVVSQSLSGP